MTNETVKSPCIDICSLDEQDVCVGCYRTLQEITDWSAMDNAQRNIVLRNSQLRDQQSSA